MNSFFAFLFLCFFSTTVWGAMLEDVVLIESVQKKDETILKLRVRSLPDSFFYVKMVSDDPKAAEKMAIIKKKIESDEGYTLNLEIPSFSPRPNGSKYMGRDVKFSGKDK